MGTIFHEIYDFLKNSEKELQISKSGSTKNSSNERIRSGQSYLYKKYGMESEVIEIRFNKKISGGMLHQALTDTCKRYPYFNTRLIEKDGDFYIVQNEQAMIPKRTKELARLGHISCGYHLLDVTYYDYTIYVSFHHALCDGRGVMPFVETLIHYYCKQKYNSSTIAEGVRLSDDPLLPNETADPFMQSYAFDESKEFISFSRDAFSIPENKPAETPTDYRCELKVNAVDFMRVCKENNATPVILTSLLMSRAIAEMYPEYDKPINANIATDMREALDCPNTYKNCVKSMILPYSREFAEKSLKEQATEHRQILKAQRDRDYCRKEANAMLGLFDKLDSLSGFEEKQKIMSYFDSFLLNTYVISYLGQFKLGDNARYIEEMYLYNSGSAGLGITMIACPDHFCLGFKQSFASDRYVRAFSAQLEKFGINHTVSEMIPFLTPTDSLIKRDHKEKEKK